MTAVPYAMLLFLIILEPDVLPFYNTSLARHVFYVLWGTVLFIVEDSATKKG